jgi:hypothetical protein
MQKNSTQIRSQFNPLLGAEMTTRSLSICNPQEHRQLDGTAPPPARLHHQRNEPDRTVIDFTGDCPTMTTQVSSKYSSVKDATAPSPLATGRADARSASSPINYKLVHRRAIRKRDERVVDRDNDVAMPCFHVETHGARPLFESLSMRETFRTSLSVIMDYGQRPAWKPNKHLIPRAKLDGGRATAIDATAFS